VSNVTPTYIKEHFPGLITTQTDAFINRMIAWAENEVSATIWKGLEDQGVAYLAAHYIYTAPDGTGASPGAPGAVTSERVGDQSISYSAPSNPASNDLSLSSFGQAYIRLRRMVATSPLVG
jgi:hypothetical protein